MANRPTIFKWRQTEPAIILCAVRWYLRYSPPSPQARQQVLPRRRDLHSYQGPVVLSVSGNRFDRSRIPPNGCSAKALRDQSPPQPRVINTDLAPIYTSAIPDIKKEGTLRRRCCHRPVQYLNNIIEQDHGSIKRRVNAKQGFREFQAARRTILGYEAIHRLAKGQVRWVSGTDVRRQNQFIDKMFGLAA